VPAAVRWRTTVALGVMVIAGLALITIRLASKSLMYVGHWRRFRRSCRLQ
jgi:hypothetical protein